MDITLRFLGAARNVTGSKILVEAGDRRILIDYGMIQEWKLKERNWNPLPVPPSSVDAVLLTHAHLDHCGLLPKLVTDGFGGVIHCTGATAALARVVLLDSARLQEEDVEFKKRRHTKEGRKSKNPVAPLYTEKDVKNALPLFRSHRYDDVVEVAEGIQAVFHDAGHILGSSMIELRIKHNGTQRTLLFSGDLGRANKPILQDPEAAPQADVVVIESTYGNRLHTDTGDVQQLLADVVNDTRKRGGNVIIPSFAIGRSQEMLYHLAELMREDKIPHLPVFVDSPMAISVTDIFEQFPELFDDEMRELLRTHESPFEFDTLQMSRTASQSKAINHIRGTAIIIAGSGMCTGGRVKHHLVQNIARPESTILFVGYQAEGTLGGEISRGGTAVRILGQEYRVRARVEQIHGFSAHADQKELQDWLTALPRPPRRVLVNHGDTEAALELTKLIDDRPGWQATAPELGDRIVLS
ncbi:MAG: MBL fold metallo-hydrolase [Pseudomonadota bacterium]